MNLVARIQKDTEERILLLPQFMRDDFVEGKIGSHRERDAVVL